MLIIATPPTSWVDFVDRTLENFQSNNRRKKGNCKQSVICYNCPTMSSVTFTIDTHTCEQIDTLARITRKPKETVLREVVETGLKSYQTTPTKGVKALVDLAEWAEKHNITGPKDLSTNHNKYAWDE